MNTLLDKAAMGLGLTDDLGIVFLGRSLHAFRCGEPDVVRSYPLTWVPETPPMPDVRLNAEVRDGLTTRRHLGEFQVPQPILSRGEVIDPDPLIAVVREAIRELLPRRCRLIKPRVITTYPPRGSFSHGQPTVQARAMLEIIENAGARCVYLTEFGMVTGLGMGLELCEKEVCGVLSIEEDWSYFSVITYADEIAGVFVPYGANDIDLSDDASYPFEQLIQGIAEAAAELRDPPLGGLSESGIHCCGLANSPAWVDRLASTTGFKCNSYTADQHPAIGGTATYLELVNTGKFNRRPWWMEQMLQS